MKKIIILLVLFSISFCHKKEEAHLYFCPMHPEYVSSKPGKCPICGMDLQKREVETSQKTTFQQKLIFLSEKDQKDLSINFVKVEKKNLIQKIRLPGEVAFDLDLYNTLLEYKQILNLVGRENISKENWDFRLKQLGLSPQEISLFLEKEKAIDPNAFLFRGKSPFAIVYLQVYESDFPYVKNQTKVQIRSKSYPNIIFHGQVLGISEIADSLRGVFRARVKVYDPKHKLKPKMFVEGELIIEKRAVLAIPYHAVLDTGFRKLVFVAQDEHHLFPQEIETGLEQDGFIEVTRGLREGQKIATGATFLIESERQISSFGGH